MTGLRHGVYLPPFGPFGDPGTIVDLAVRAEAAGWDGLFLWDHVVGQPPIVDPWTTLSAAVAATKRVLLGTTVTPLPRRRPWVVARQVETVSRLAEGRVVLGVGLGSDESGDFSRFGESTDLAVRSAMLDEGLDIVRAVWAGAGHDHVGTHYAVDLPAGDPAPHPIPIWTGSSVRDDRVIRRAATCDGIFPIADRPLTPAQVAELVERLHGAGLEPDRPFDVAVAGNASHAWEHPNPDGIDLDALARSGATWWLESLIHFDPLELSQAVVDAGPPGS